MTDTSRYAQDENGEVVDLVQAKAELQEAIVQERAANAQAKYEAGDSRNLVDEVASNVTVDDDPWKREEGSFDGLAPPPATVVKPDYKAPEDTRAISCPTLPERWQAFFAANAEAVE